MSLMGFEWKKVVTKRANQIILILLAVLVAYSCSRAVRQVEWIDGSGNAVNGHAAAVKLRREKEQWTGVLDQTMLEKALAHLREIYSTTPQDLQQGENNWPLRSRLQGIQDIAELLGLAFADTYDTFEEMVEKLQPEDLSRFYEKRVEALSVQFFEEGNWGYANYNENEKQYIVEQYQSARTPFSVGYQEGWVQVTEQLPSLMKYAMILLSFLLAGIFSDEFSWKTDAVYYNTYYGRTKSTIAKLWIGFLVITVMYWLCVGVFSLVVLGSLGTEGAEQILQSDASYWSTRYNMTFLQYYVLTVGAGYCGFLFVGFLVMWISAKTRSPILAVLIPSLLLLIPMFLHEIYSLFLRKVIGLLPHWLLDIPQAMHYVYLYQVGGQVTSLISIILPLYSCLTLLLVFLCYREYRYKQIA